VLDAAGEQFGALDGDRLAVHVEALGDGPGRARRRELQAGERQAALLVLLRLTGQVEYRVDQVPVLVVVVAHVEGEHPQRHADLWRGEPDAGRVQHGLGEVRHQLLQLAIEVAHGFRGSAQHRVAK
jgi:hypothetical protein